MEIEAKQTEFQWWGSVLYPCTWPMGNEVSGVGRALRGCPASSAVAGEWSGLRWRRVNTLRASYPIVTLVDRNPKAGQEFAHVSAAATSESIIPTSCKHVPCVGCGRQGLAEPGLWFICTWRLCQRSTCHLGWLTGSDPRTTPRPVATTAGTPAPYGPELQAQVCD